MQQATSNPRRRTKLASLFAVAFLSSTLTVLMAGLLLLALNFGFMGGVGPIVSYFNGKDLTKEAKGDLQGRGYPIDDRSASAEGVIGKKTSVIASVAFKNSGSAANEAAEEVVAANDNDGEFAPSDASFNETNADIEMPVDLPEGVPAMLRRGKNGNGVEIGNFRSATIGGGAEECVSLGYTMLSAARAKEDLLNVMVANKQITIAKICASNGTIILTCRNGKISISPRRARPDDSCSGA